MKINAAHFLTLQPPEKPTKIARVLHRLATGETYNFFRAESRLHDHVLRSTVSELGRRYRIKINRKWETVPGYMGEPTRCKRYQLDTTPENLTKCYWLLKSWGWKDQQSGTELPPPPEAA